MLCGQFERESREIKSAERFSLVYYKFGSTPIEKDWCKYKVFERSILVHSLAYLSCKNY